ncbi:MAG: D-alanyl-D-alanine carboxypeptidase/D-alanyl-D-alanine-endopeptidase [Chitinophagaceae bacterium]
MFFFLFAINASAQPVTQKLQQAFQQFETDDQLKHAVSSLYVIDATTGQVVFNKNSQVGLAPASTQKIITGVTAFELLGDGYGYKTWLYLDGKVRNDTLLGNFIIKGSGDPTFGSARFDETKPTVILDALVKMLKEKNIRYITGDIIIDESSFESNGTPDGWIWQDIGNYYGAGAYAFNWQENQYDLFLKGGPDENDPVEIVKTEPELEVQVLNNELKSGPKGSGDNAYIYIPPYSSIGFVRGTIPADAQNFSISGSMPYPFFQFNKAFEKTLVSAGIKVRGRLLSSLNFAINKKTLKYEDKSFSFFVSPSLALMMKWFLQKSINLYGEAFVKTFAFEKKGFGSTDSGIEIVKDFWEQKGIDENELNISDGSGLSPQNRVTTHAQVEILKYAKKQAWFSYFYTALPEYNGMKMKSGTIKDVKAYCGYHKAKDGKEYIFSFLVNNYSGKASSLVSKMYTVLDVLK